MQLQPGPVRVVVFWMLEPGFPPGRGRAEQRPAGLAERQRTSRLGERALRPHLPNKKAEPGSLLVGDHVAPAEEVVEAERSGTPARGADVMRAHGDDRGLHLR